MQSEQINWQAKQFSNRNEVEQHLATSNIIREADNINALYLDCAERAIKALFLLNSGGAVTVLAYIYNAKEVPISIFVKISLVIFLIGLVLAFDVVVRDFYYMQKKLLEFHEDVRSFLLNNFSFSSIRRFQPSPELVNKYAMFTFKIGEASASCAILGIFLGSWLFHIKQQ